MSDFANQSTYGGSNRTLTAMFDSRADANEAAARLRALGLPDASVRVVGEGSTAASAPSNDKGFWEGLADFFFPEDDRAAYAEGLRRGGYLITVSNIPATSYDQVLDILDDEGSVNLDERSESWRSEGWTGGSGWDSTSVSETSMSGTGVAGSGIAERSSATGAFSAGASRSDEEVIPVVEEQLRVGKRDVNLGRVRVRSYVVEEPVSEQVNLRDERVVVERRPVDRAVGAADAVFTDRTLEAEEHIEEAVVAKTAHVKEEIALRRQAEERTETVSDTIRHTEVEVEDERSDGRLNVNRT